MKKEITYTEINSANYPNFALPEQPKVGIGKYAKCDLTFLKYYDTKGKYVDISKRPRYNKNDDLSIQFCKITRYFLL